jgi:hypothetical protein
MCSLQGVLEVFLISLAICSGPLLPAELLVEGFFSGVRYCFIADSLVSCLLHLPSPPPFPLLSGPLPLPPPLPNKKRINAMRAQIARGWRGRSPIAAVAAAAARRLFWEF